MIPAKGRSPPSCQQQAIWLKTRLSEARKVRRPDARESQNANALRSVDGALRADDDDRDRLIREGGYGCDPLCGRVVRRCRDAYATPRRPRAAPHAHTGAATQTDGERGILSSIDSWLGGLAS